MSDSFKPLFQGLIPNSLTVLATVPAAKMWVVKRVTVYNADSITVTYSLEINGNPVTPGAISLPINGGCSVDDGTFTLASGNTISGIASVASQLTISLFGDEVS